MLLANFTQSIDILYNVRSLNQLINCAKLTYISTYINNLVIVLKNL